MIDFSALIDDSSGPDDCHRWKGSHDREGYPTFKGQRATHYALQLDGRPVTPEKPCALHTCPGGDNLWCINVKHLRPGTMTENIQDRDQRGRTAKGERHGSKTKPECFTGPINFENMRRGEKVNTAKLTTSQVLEIRISSEDALSIATRLGVSRSAIYHIRRGRNWRHL